MQKNLGASIYNFFFALSASIVGAIVFSWPLLFIFVTVQKTYQIVNMSVLKVMHNYNQLMLYLLWPFKNKLQMDNFSTSKSAAEHFADVKRLLILAVLVFIICLVIYIIAKKRNEKELLKISKIEAWIFLLLPIIILPFAIMNFDSFFIFFHHLFFANSNWLFDPNTDPIINVLTEEFFASCFGVFGIIYELYFINKIMHK